MKHGSWGSSQAPDVAKCFCVAIIKEIHLAMQEIKESACSSGDPSSIPGLGRSAGEGIGYPLQYSWASLVAQLVKNLPAMWETWVPSLGWEDSPGEGKGYLFQYSGLENSMDCIVHGVAKSQTRLSLHSLIQEILSFCWK